MRYASWQSPFSSAGRGLRPPVKFRNPLQDASESPKEPHSLDNEPTPAPEPQDAAPPAENAPSSEEARAETGAPRPRTNGEPRRFDRRGPRDVREPRENGAPA